MRIPAGVTGTTHGMKTLKNRVSSTARSVAARFSLALKKLVLGLALARLIMLCTFF